MIKAVVLFLVVAAAAMAAVAQSNNTISPVNVNVGVVVDLGERIGKMGKSCIEMAMEDFYASNPQYKTRLILHTRDSKANVVGAAAAAVDLIKNVEVQAILGPATSTQADFMIDLGEKSQVPIISFSASSPSLTSTRSSYFFRATTNDSTQVNAISALIQSFGWRRVVPIYVDNQYGQEIIPYLTDALQEVGAKVPYKSAISPLVTNDQIVGELYKLMTMSTRVFVVHMLPSLGTRLFAKAKEIGMMGEGYVWILTDGLSAFLNSMDNSVIDSMQGVLGVMPYVPKSKKLEDFKVRWKRKLLQDNNSSSDIVDPELDIFGLWAYDAAVGLAMAVEEVGAAVASMGFHKANVSSNATELESLRVSTNGPSLIQALSNTSFNGLTGDFLFVNGQWKSSTFQILNVVDDGATGIGFWTPTKGLVRKLNSTTSASDNKSSPLRTIIWPGETNSVPKGWEISTNGERLKILVPVLDDFSEIVKVTRDPSTNTISIGGYCIDLFDSVVKELPYAVTYDYIPFANPDWKLNGTYNDMIYQVYLGNYDAAVGDITIIYNRSRYVDFTLPYTESGIQMVVPIRDNRSKNAWVFLKPLTWDLWVSIFCFFVFTGFVVWVLEHRINEDFRGPPLHQAGTSFWFSFSTMMLAHKERVVSNLARVVVIIWCFVVLILTQAYTASLTSLLTVQHLRPTVTDVSELIKGGHYVGYQNGSFVLGILKSLGFDEKKLVVYDSLGKCDELFQKGTGNGGIAAAFDEVPYIRLFLAKYCSKYTMIEPSFKTDGFGFAFPMGSPLVPDISRAILKVTEGDKMKQLASPFLEQGSCIDSTTSVSSESLSLNNFRGLFLIVGTAAVTALLIFTIMFIYEHRKVLYPSSDSEPSTWRRILNLLRIYDQKDLKFHTFRKSGLSDGVVLSLPSMSAPSPSAYSVQTEFPCEQGSSPAEFALSSQQEPQEVSVDIKLGNQSSEISTTVDL